MDGEFRCFKPVHTNIYTSINRQIDNSFTEVFRVIHFTFRLQRRLRERNEGKRGRDTRPVVVNTQTLNDGRRPTDTGTYPQDRRTLLELPNKENEKSEKKEDGMN